MNQINQNLITRDKFDEQTIQAKAMLYAQHYTSLLSMVRDLQSISSFILSAENGMNARMPYEYVELLTHLLWKIEQEQLNTFGRRLSDVKGEERSDGRV